MRTTITVRHCEVSEVLRERAVAVTARLAQLSPHALDATVVFGMDPAAHTAEIRLHARGRRILVGQGKGSDHKSALDRAEAKLRGQLVKAGHARQQGRRSPAGRRPTRTT
jgi:ribosome-associated translation inhibitor RaiA